MRLIPVENEIMQLCLQTELDEEKSLHSQKLLYCGEHNKSASRKKTNVALNAIKKFCMQARNWPDIFDKLKPELGPIRKARPDL